ncbi:MAG: GNAT family N-acetyltransferase [SAR324 cluster bacterium]|nr:GNAT family N-acetyltransferase [SAR324 cluster bacterium]
MKVNLNPPEPISSIHRCELFDCGNSALNDFLKKYALQNHANNSARTYVATRDLKVVGYYSLAYGSVTPMEAPPRITKGLGQYPVPILLIARLAVDIQEQGKGMGKGLLKDALGRAIQASEIAGLRAVVVHAKDEQAKAFYERYDFVSSPLNQFHLYLLLKDLKKTIALSL